MDHSSRSAARNREPITLGSGLEAVQNVLHLEITIPGGQTFQIMTNVEMQGEKLVLSQLHIQGEAGSMGAREFKQAMENFLKDIGRQQGAKMVRLEGGVRKSGTAAQRTPKPIEIEVD